MNLSQRASNPSRQKVASALLFAAYIVVASCKEAGKPPAMQPQASNPSWSAQYRSPQSAKYADTNALALFSYNSASAVSPDVVFVAADYPLPNNLDERKGVVLRTTDGGQNWVELALDGVGFRVDVLNAIHFINQNEGWIAAASSIAGKDGQIGVALRTTDGGATWSAKKLGFKQIPTSIFFVDSQKGWMSGVSPLPNEEAEGGPSDILVTSDGGETWESQMRVPVSIVDLFFTDKQTGWAGGYGGLIYHTTNGGLTWERQRTGLESDPNLAKSFYIGAVHFIDSQYGWAGARSADDPRGFVLGTTDGGATWKILLASQDGRVRDVFFVNRTEGWATVGTGQFVYRTADGGHQWEVEPIVFDQMTPLYRLAGYDGAHLWAVGGGAIFHRSIK